MFSAGGIKIDETTERAIGKGIHDDVGGASAPDGIHSARADEFRREYLDHLKREANGFSARGIKIVVDCANGASSELAPKLFASLGAEAMAIHNDPDGRTSNENCGSTQIAQ